MGDVSHESDPVGDSKTQAFVYTEGEKVAECCLDVDFEDDDLTVGRFKQIIIDDSRVPNSVRENRAAYSLYLVFKNGKEPRLPDENHLQIYYPDLATEGVRIVVSDQQPNLAKTPKDFNVTPKSDTSTPPEDINASPESTKKA